MSSPRQELVGENPLSEAKVTELVKVLVDGDVPFGPASRGILVSRAARACALDEIQKFMAVVTPYAKEAGVSFNPLKPTLSSADLGAVETVAKLVKLLVHERLLPIIKKGSSAADLVSAYSHAMLALFRSRPAELDELIADTLQQVADIGTFFLQLAAQDSHTGADPEVRQAHDGTKNLVRLAYNQSPYWVQRDQEMRQIELAMQSLGPELRILSANLESGQQGADEAVIKKLPVLLDSLPPAATSSLLGKLMEHERATVERLKVDIDKGALSEEQLSTLKAVAASCDKVSALAFEATWKKQFAEVSRQTKAVEEMVERQMQSSRCKGVLATFLAEESKRC